MSGQHWSDDRKGIRTVFTLSILKTFLPILNARFKTLTKNLEQYVDRGMISMSEHIFQCTFNNVCGK